MKLTFNVHRLQESLDWNRYLPKKRCFLPVKQDNGKQIVVLFFVFEVRWGASTVAIGNPERHMRKASHSGSKQQQRSCVAISLTIACSRHAYILLFFAHILFVVNHTINVTPPERLQQYQWLTSKGRFWKRNLRLRAFFQYLFLTDRLQKGAHFYQRGTIQWGGQLPQVAPPWICHKPVDVDKLVVNSTVDALCSAIHEMDIFGVVNE